MLFNFFKDRTVENLWNQARRAKYELDENNEFITSSKLILRNGRKIVHVFERGTKRSDVWEWFDDNYSKGVEFLLYGD